MLTKFLLLISIKYLWWSKHSKPAMCARFDTNCVRFSSPDASTMKKKLDNLLSFGAIFPANPGACPYSSKTVFALKKHYYLAQ